MLKKQAFWSCLSVTFYLRKLLAKMANSLAPAQDCGRFQGNIKNKLKLLETQFSLKDLEENF